MFLLGRNLVFSDVGDPGQRNILAMGAPLGFNLLNNFSGEKYVFLGRFANLRPELTLWRIRKMDEILNGKRASIPQRLTLGLITNEQEKQAEALFEGLSLLIAVTSSEEKRIIKDRLEPDPINYPVEVFSVDDVRTEVFAIAKTAVEDA